MELSFHARGPEQLLFRHVLRPEGCPRLCVSDQSLRFSLSWPRENVHVSRFFLHLEDLYDAFCQLFTRSLLDMNESWRHQILLRPSFQSVLFPSSHERSSLVIANGLQPRICPRGERFAWPGKFSEESRWRASCVSSYVFGRSDSLTVASRFLVDDVIDITQLHLCVSKKQVKQSVRLLLIFEGDQEGCVPGTWTLTQVTGTDIGSCGILLRVRLLSVFDFALKRITITLCNCAGRLTELSEVAEQSMLL